jgi:hypothetical protein
MIIAPGREVSINGKRYTVGMALPESLPGNIAEQARKACIIEKKEVKDEPASASRSR